MEIYRKIMTVREKIVGAIGMRKTRAGHILIEFDRKVAVGEVAEKLKAALSDKMEVLALVNRTTMQIKNIDPLTTKEEMVVGLKREWGRSVGDSIGTKSMRMALWGTQMAVVVLPTNAIPREEGLGRFRIGLTTASARILPDVRSCYRCHILGHTAARCTVACPGRKLCRRCGSGEHTMKECRKEPRCAMCSRKEGATFRHVTDSLVCPMVRAETRRRRG